jgi:hypothetical protein
MHERAYERDSHKHANTSIYERAYERHPHKHDNTRFLCVLMRGILISTLNTSIYERAYERNSHRAG